MEPITQYIAAHWVAWLFAAISGILATAYHRLAGRLKKEQIKTQAINAAVLALLHDRIYQAVFSVSASSNAASNSDSESPP